MIAPDPSLSPSGGPASCWVKTELAEQKHVWFINRIFGGNVVAVSSRHQDGRPCFGVRIDLVDVPDG